MMTKLPETVKQNHVPWLHYLRRSLIESGELSQMVEDGLRGLTIDLSVIAQTINSSADYDRVLDTLIAEGTSFDDLPRALLIDDVQRAATILNPVYEESQRLDGFISLPIDPALAYDTVRTVAAVRHLLAEVNYPNVMVADRRWCLYQCHAYFFAAHLPGGG
ncbi:MAG: transaldolase family protein [Anaerolineae bacterium]